MRLSQVLRSKKSENLSLHQKLSLGQTFFAAVFSLKYRHFTETTTTDIDILSQV